MTRPAPPEDLRAAGRAMRGPHLAALGLSLTISLLMLTTSLYTMQVFDRVLGSRSVHTLAALTVLAGIATALMAGLEAIRQGLLHHIGGWIAQRLEEPVLRRALAEGHSGAEAMRDLAHWRSFVSSPAFHALHDLPWLPVFILVLAILHPALGLLALGSAVLLVGLAVLGERWAGGHAVAAQEAQAEAIRLVDSACRAHETIGAMGMERAVTAKVGAASAAAEAAAAASMARAALLLGMGRFLRVFMQIGAMGLGALLVLQDAMTPGAMIAGSILFGRAFAPADQVASAWRQIGLARAARHRLNQRLRRPAPPTPAVALPAPEGRLSVEGATVVQGGRPVLQGVSLTVQPGEIVAIVGPSGAGKSTLARLLVGAVVPAAGVVRLDGAVLAGSQREVWGRHVGYLAQGVDLIDATVAETIARMETPDDAAVIEAARLAGCHEAILRLPQGYATPIGPAGAFLSGGQRQLVGLARAIYRMPRLVVLDEPNSHLDPDGDAALTRAVLALKAAGSAIVLVSHRPAIVQAADRIVVVRDGRIAADGPRAQLIPALASTSIPSQETPR
jgi:ATP-binding cassette subfamily C protein/ATP-binding cassette subfamily C protein EexD